jgi:serine/threonine protein kinase
MRHVGQRVHQRGKQADTFGSLLGKTIQVGNYLVTVERKLGQGGFADVYQVVSRTDSTRYALKHFRIDQDQEKFDSVKAECILMKQLKSSPHVLTLYAACFAGDPVPAHGFCLLELCSQDLVKALTANHRHMTEHDILHIFHQVAQGLAHMHNQNPPIAHWCVSRVLCLR